MPFGARSSSTYMQKVSGFVIQALNHQGISTDIYLDDLIFYFHPTHDPAGRLQEAITQLKALRLPLAEEKYNRPRSVLNIWGSGLDRQVSIPKEKIHNFLQCLKRPSISKKVNQMIVGKVIHILSCVPASRTFINHILQAHRDAHKQDHVVVGEGFRQDLIWFQKFLRKFNGVSMIKPSEPQYIINADACPVGGGATDYEGYIAYNFPENCFHFNISVLEALNCLVACRTLVTKEKHSSIKI